MVVYVSQGNQCTRERETVTGGEHNTPGLNRDYTVTTLDGELKSAFSSNITDYIVQYY